MIIDGMKIHNKGIEIKLEHEQQLRQICRMVKAISQSFELNMKLVRCEDAHEVLLWGMVKNLPVGIYSRGLSLGHALDSTIKKMASHCAKTRALQLNHGGISAKHQVNGKLRLGLAA